jgi:hypothetical protein
MKRLILLFLLLFGLVSNIDAQGRPEIRFKATGATIGCASGATFVYLDGPFANVNNALNYPYEGMVYDANGNIYEHAVGTASGSTLNNPTIGWGFSTGNTGGSANASFPIPNDTAYNLRFVLYYPTGEPSWVAYVRISKCNGGSITQLRDFPFPSAGLPTITDPGARPDDRINWHYGDAHIGILYPADNGGINLYSYADESYIFDFVTAAMLEPYSNDLPAAPILLAQHGLISAYLLSDGRIQFNLGPDAEGKWYEVILDSLDDRDIDGFAHDPNE